MVLSMMTPTMDMPTATPATARPTSRSEQAGHPAPLPAVAGGPRILLRGEGLLVLVGALIAYGHLGGGWGLFAALFLVPDLSMLGYLAGPRAGAIAYNAAHSYLAPGALAIAAPWIPTLAPFAVIWIAHIGMDRMLGYGLKYATAFGDTHLGRVGLRRRAA